jgi:hypothetical protein
MVKAKSNRDVVPKAGSGVQATPDTKDAGSGHIWMRDDGAICIDNECVVIQSASDGTVDFTVNPNKCTCKVGNAIYESILKSALSGKGSRITITPKEDK